MRHALVLVAATTMAALLAAPALPLAAEPDPTGSWRLRVEWPDQPAEVTLEVTEGEPGLEAHWIGPRGTLEAREVEFDRPDLEFTLVVSVSREGGSEETTRLEFRATIDGDRLRGSLRSPGREPFAVEGARAAPGDRRPEPGSDPH